MARMLAPIISVKHYVSKINASLASGAILNVDAVVSVVAPATSATNQVQEGSVVKAVYCEIWAKSKAAAGASTQYNVAVEKVPANAPDMTFAQMANLMAYLNKKNILLAQQANLGDTNTQAVPVLRGWIKIPKGKQRFGFGDKFTVNLTATGASVDFCGLFVFKEYR